MILAFKSVHCWVTFQGAQERDNFVATILRATGNKDAEDTSNASPCHIDPATFILEASWVDVPFDLAESLVDFPDGTIGRAATIDEGWVHL